MLLRRVCTEQPECGHEMLQGGDPLTCKGSLTFYSMSSAKRDKVKLRNKLLEEKEGREEDGFMGLSCKRLLSNIGTKRTQRTEVLRMQLWVMNWIFPNIL